MAELSYAEEMLIKARNEIAHLEAFILEELGDTFEEWLSEYDIDWSELADAYEARYGPDAYQWQDGDNSGTIRDIDAREECVKDWFWKELDKADRLEWAMSWYGKERERKQREADREMS